MTKILPAFGEMILRGEFKVEEHHDLQVEVVDIDRNGALLRVSIVNRRKAPMVQVAEVRVQSGGTLTLEGVGRAFNITQTYA